jgi:hypothetical protein
MKSVRALVITLLSALMLFAGCSSSNTTTSDTPPPDTATTQAADPAMTDRAPGVAGAFVRRLLAIRSAAS